MESLKVLDYMNKRPVKFTPHMPIAEAVEALLSSKQSGGPVVDEAGNLIGFLSEQDCLKQMLDSTYYREQIAHVEDVMVAQVKPVSPRDSILELTQRFIQDGYKMYPVVDDNGALMGVITRSDVLYAIDVHLKDEYKHTA